MAQMAYQQVQRDRNVQSGRNAGRNHEHLVDREAIGQCNFIVCRESANVRPQHNTLSPTEDRWECACRSRLINGLPKDCRRVIARRNHLAKEADNSTVK